MTGLRFRHLHPLSLLALAALLLPAAGHAQANVLQGRVIGPDGVAVAGQTVVLHRVAGGAGATIAEATTDAQGSFALRFDAPELDGDAAYFVAARWQDELYLGPPFRTPIDSTADYTMQVGVPGTSASVLLGNAQPAGAAPPPAPDATFPYRAWLLLIIPLLVLALGTGYLLTRGRGAGRRRKLLLEVALLDDAFESELEQGDIADSRRYWAERRTLLERLARES